MARQLTDLVVAVGAIPGTRPGCWCPSIRVSGHADGAPFAVLVDLYEVECASEADARAAGEREASRRLEALRSGRLEI